MAIELRIQLDSATAFLAALGVRLDSSDELLAPALPVVAAAIERDFDEEGRPVRWAPLSARYAAWKARRFGAGLRILERSGALRRSISTRIEGGALVASTAVPYAAFHQFGTRFIPARPFLVLTESDNEEVAQAVADSLGTAYRVPGTSP